MSSGTCGLAGQQRIGAEVVRKSQPWLGKVLAAKGPLSRSRRPDGRANCASREILQGYSVAHCVPQVRKAGLLSSVRSLHIDVERSCVFVPPVPPAVPIVRRCLSIKRATEERPHSKIS